MKSIVREVEAEDNTRYKAVVFYEIGLPRVYEVPSDEDPKAFIKDITKQISVSVNVLGWAVVNISEGKVIKSEGLSDAMYREMSSLFGVTLNREV